MSGRRMTRRAGETQKTPPARALLPAAAAAAVVVLVALSLAGCDDMDLLGLVRLRVTGASGIVIYVSPEGSDENSGLLPELAVAAIHTGMDRAEEHGASEVRVAEGTYVVDGYEDEIDMRSGVALKGGYSNDFTTWDPESHESIILADSPFGFISAYSDVQDASIEGFSVQTATAGYGTHSGVITIVSGASLSVLNNKFRVHLSGNSFDQTGMVIWQWNNPDYDPVQCNITIHGNDIVVRSSNNSSDCRLSAIELEQPLAGSHVTVSANKITVVREGTGYAGGIDIWSHDNLRIWNNVISVVGPGDAEGILVRGGAAGSLENNTIIVSDGGAGNAEAISFTGGSTSYVDVIHNILGSRDGVGVGVINEQGGTFSYTNNLCFGFGSESQGNVTDGGGNTFVAADIFSEVFSSDYDTDLSDGDDSDYHLDDTSGGGPYAVDQGSAETIGPDVDFEGDSRPQGAAVDRGADEKVP